MPNTPLINPILLLLAAPPGLSKGASPMATQGQRPGLFQEGEFAGLLGLLNESGGAGRVPKDQPDLPNQKKSGVSGEALLVGLIGQVLLQKKDSFLNGQLGPQAKEAYRTLLEAYLSIVSRPKGEEGKGLRNSNGGKAAGKVSSLDRMLRMTGMLGVAPKRDGALLSDVKDFRQPTLLGNQKAKSPASFQEKTSAASIPPKTPFEPLRMNMTSHAHSEHPLMGAISQYKAESQASKPSPSPQAPSQANAETDRLLEILSALLQPQAQAKEEPRSDLAPPLLQASGQASKPSPSPQAPSQANAETDRLLELLSALLQPQAQAKEEPRSDLAPPLLQASGQASKPSPSPQAPSQADPRGEKGWVKMFVGLLDELYGSKGSTEKFQAVLESRSPEHRAWLNLKETPEFASKIQAESIGGVRQKAMPLLQSKDKQDANIFFQEAMASSRSFRPNKAEAQEVTRQLQEAILGSLSQDRPAIQQRHTVTLALEPPDLGQLTVRIDLKGNDLKVFIVANSHEAGQALKQGHTGLQQNLREQGLDLSQFSLSIGNPGSFPKEFEGFFGQPSMPHTVNLSNGQEAASSSGILPVLPYHKGMLSIRV